MLVRTLIAALFVLTPTGEKPASDNPQLLHVPSTRFSDYLAEFLTSESDWRDRLPGPRLMEGIARKLESRFDAPEACLLYTSDAADE